MDGWALDLGTTNSALARWSSSRGEPELVELPTVCRIPEGDDVLEAPRMVPSAVQLTESPGWLDRFGALGLVERHAFVGRTAFIGREALERNRACVRPAFVPSFKSALGAEPGRPLARAGHRPVSARQAARAFLRELLAEAKRTTGARIRDLVVAAPVRAFETYRAEVQRILQGLGVRTVRFVDEPLAAALGYGLGLTGDALVLVVDVGGGTMHVELARLSARGAGGGLAHVVAKRGLPLGGDAVDSWILADLCERLGVPIDAQAGDEESRFWRRLMLAEACRVKEAVYFVESADLLLAPPGLLVLEGRPRPGTQLATFTRARLVELLEGHGFYQGLETSIDGVLSDAGEPAEAVDDVLVVGGSTLLPGVFPLLSRRFERQRLRAWQPFEAVAYGAASFAAGELRTADFIIHDYAFVTHEAGGGPDQHTVVVPKGTRFPTPPDLWKGQVVPTCALGAPETVFKLVICEVAKDDGAGRRFVWDAAGDLKKVGGRSGSGQVVVPLNAANPTLGTLDPPHDPRDRRPRLEISFGVNADRWLVATVRDLLSRRELMRAEPVVRLV